MLLSFWVIGNRLGWQSSAILATDISFVYINDFCGQTSEENVSVSLITNNEMIMVHPMHKQHG
jgi:hypothetical protein